MSIAVFDTSSELDVKSIGVQEAGVSTQKKKGGKPTHLFNPHKSRVQLILLLGR